MADNTVLSVGAGGDTMRDKDRAGVKTPIVAIDLNPAGSETLMAGAMPVTGTFWQATQPVSGTFWQATQPISGTVTANAGTNLNTSALALEAGHLATIDGKLPALGQALAAASVPVVLTAAQITTLTPVSTVTANQGGSWSVTVGAALPAGTNVIGHVIVDAGSAVIGHVIVDSGTITTVSTVTAVTTVSTVTTVAAVTAITNALPAGTNLLGQVSASHETATIYNGTTALAPKFAVITASSSGATTIVAAVTSKRIRVLRWSLSSNGSVNVKWQSHVTPTDLTGLHYLTQFASAGGAYCPVGIFQTVSGEALDINLSGAVAVGGELTYVEV